MTIRDAIDQLLTGETTDQAAAPDPATVMADNGYGDVPSELFGTALVHFSDTAPLAQADALAPVVTRVSPIPFEEVDLTPLGDDGPVPDLDGSDPYALFTSAAPQLADFDDPGINDNPEVEGQDINMDDDLEIGTQDVNMDDDPGIEMYSPEDLSDADFGSGTIDTGLIDDLEAPQDETYTNDDAMLDDLAPRFDASSVSSEAQDTIEEAGVNLFSVEFDETDEADEGIDPDDLDFSD